MPSETALAALGLLLEKPQGVSLPWLCAQLGTSASSVLRTISESNAQRPHEVFSVLHRELGGSAQVRLTAFGQSLAHAGALTQAGLAREVPVALVFNGISHVVLMASPAQLSELALGFALSEGVIDTAQDWRSATVTERALPHGLAFEVQAEISPRCMARLAEQRRSMAGPTGCGLCGLESLEALASFPTPQVSQALEPAQVSQAALQAAIDLPSWQLANQQCGSLHAAAWVGLNGQIAAACEDAGRHNALDKLLGTLALQEALEPSKGFPLMTSRASSELVRKCARLGLAALVTVSGPTTLAAAQAKASGLQLWAWCRPPGVERVA